MDVSNFLSNKLKLQIVVIGIFLFVFQLTVFAQIGSSNLVVSFTSEIETDIPQFLVSSPDINSLLKEDNIESKYKDIPVRFGVEIPVELDLLSQGKWENIAGVGRICRLKIVAKDAKSINLNYARYVLPKGATLHLYSSNRNQVIGAFTTKNQQPDSTFSTRPIFSDEIVLEYFIPNKSLSAYQEIKIRSVVYGYRDLRTFGDSGPCEINAICEEATWGNEIRSIVLYMTSGNTRLCSGTLINNVKQDGKPFVLTANHCSISANNIFVFDYKSADCAMSNDGPLTKSVSGCQILARDTRTDFALVQLNSTPPLSYNVFYAGWSIGDTSSQSNVGLHHPRGDVMKISTDNNSAISSGYGVEGDDYWKVGNWEQGATEPTSSGSSLFNQDHLLIGQLRGGGAACGNTKSDYYGKFAVSWDSITDSAQQLKYWLDPDNEMVGDVLNGYDPNGSSFNRDGALLYFTGVDSYICGEDSIYPKVALRNLGSQVITSAEIDCIINGALEQTVTYSGTTNAYGTDLVTFSPIAVTAGHHAIKFVLKGVNGQVGDENITNDELLFSYFVQDSPKDLGFRFISDEWGNELSWKIYKDNDLIYEFGGLANISGGSDSIVGSFCVSKGCYKLVLDDTGADGYCCSYGTGLTTIYNDTAVFVYDTLFSTNQQEFIFCVDTLIEGVGVTELVKKPDGFVIYPNPGKDILYVQMDKILVNETLTVFNALGYIVMEEKMLSKQIGIDTQELPSGMYYLKIQNVIKKWVKKE